jgi:hypothetical protein
MHDRSIRGQFAAFAALVEAQVDDRPALVLVEQPPRNIHVDFVVNSPDLRAPVLFGRYENRPDGDQSAPVAATRHTDRAGCRLEEIAVAFPDRRLYLFNESSWTIEPVEATADGKLP